MNKVGQNSWVPCGPVKMTSKINYGKHQHHHYHDGNKILEYIFQHIIIGNICNLMTREHILITFSFTYLQTQ